ncbi:hypothetical protein PAAG_12446 [Paracoccidioides lutzii Pb01]|uniref:Uncharacterized protein n=1 Tax=Paracoccidioides lutzii (strain ATCC MYA-826 / Pb01) TaxID=502779 RepID=A0A0A2V3E5_PARBA|nr:hypothetical protein PAAG_12446 [Paracoccidioides lutzii Pb01]KGQ00902.1 hypothetical protein PAAG_12446 [Paracoccidioides lutzii Pb01]
MGIPLIWTPPAQSGASNNRRNNAKSHPLAPSRSTIRRQRPFRRFQRGNNDTNSDNGSSRNHGYVPYYRSSMPQWVETLSREILGDSTTGEQGSVRNPSSQDNESRLDWPSSAVSSSSSTLARREIGQQLARDVVRYEAPGLRMRIPRESSLNSDTLYTPLWPPRNGPSRQSASNGNATSSRPAVSPPDLAPYSPRFAPAFPPSNNNSNELTAPASYTSSTTTLRLERSSYYGDGANDDEDEDDDDDEHNMWETLFTTITPDDNLPSFESSFTSATASASTAPTRSSANSSQTTLPSSIGVANPTRLFIPLESFADQGNHCDFLSSSEGSDTEPESDMERDPARARVAYRHRYQPRRPSPLPTTTTTTSAISSSLLSISTLPSREDSSQQQQRESRQHQQQQSNTPTETDSSTPTPSSFNVSFGQSNVLEDLHQVQAIIDRLSRRQDIPDEWWAAVGLSRNLGRGVTDVPARSGSSGNTNTNTNTNAS